MEKYTGKKAVVLGGTYGIGLSVVRTLVEGGAEVLLTGRNEQNLETVRREFGTRVHVVRSDSTNMADIEALGVVVQEKLGQIDFLHFNVGFVRIEPIEQVTEQSYDLIFNINTKGAFFTVQRLSPLIEDGGAIVFTTVTNSGGIPGFSVYSGAKAALRVFTQVFAAEFSPRGIRVNAVAPAFIKTPTMGVPEAPQARLAAIEETGNQVTPLKRNGTPEEVAQAVLFLAFDATFTTGTELLVDGGLAEIDGLHL